MKLFTCSNCGQVIYFENTWCQHCGQSTGLMEDDRQLSALSSPNKDVFVPVNRANKQYRYCANHAYDVCNWLVVADSESPYCRACGLNHLIPNLQQPEYRERWALIEAAKHRLVYSLLRFKLPFPNKIKEPEKGLRFDFVADEKDKKVFTGHDAGLITLNINEADDVERELAKKNMREPYRTLLGHFRHETGHYYWDILIKNTNNLAPCRQLFGDDSIDYDQALNLHYQNGAPANWSDNYISAYASAHPWEDWAETWAHYMHIMDTLETAWTYSIKINPLVTNANNMKADINFDPYAERNFEKILQHWLPLTYAMNSLNRSMGIGDVYPFVITPQVTLKLGFIHDICFSQSKNRNKWSLFS